MSRASRYEKSAPQGTHPISVDMVGSGFASNRLSGAQIICSGRPLSVNLQAMTARGGSRRRWLNRGNGVPSEREKLADDGLDDLTWQRVVRTVEAAHKGDVRAHDDCYNRWPDISVPLQRRTEIYIRYVLGYKINTLCGGAPTDDSVRDLAERTLPMANVLVKGSVPLYEGLFRLLLGWSYQPDAWLTGVYIDISATAALGALLVDPRKELAEVRPQLARYYAKKREFLRSRELGVDERSQPVEGVNP